MKPYACTLAAIVTSVAFTAPGAQSLAQEPIGPGLSFPHLNTLPGEFPPPIITLPQATRGVVFKTAAVHSTGTIATCFRCVSATHLGVGLYQVVFDENVQAANGWSRWVQADTLGTGSENAWCNTADRAGVPDGVWVNCQTTGGPGSQGNSKPVDASFFLFVAR